MLAAIREKLALAGKNSTGPLANSVILGSLSHDPGSGLAEVLTARFEVGGFKPEGYSCRMPSKSNRRKRRARERGLRRALREKAGEAHERPLRIDEPKTIRVPDDGLDRLFVPR